MINFKNVQISYRAPLCRPWFCLIAVSWCLTARLKQLSLVDLFEFIGLKGGQYG